MVFACAAAALMVLPTGASAKPGYLVKPKSLELHVDVPTRNGWAMSLDTAGHRQVVLTASKGEFIALYKTLGRVTRKGIEADFGSFGHVSLRFHAKPEPRRVPAPSPPEVRQRPQRPRCTGRAPVVERGIFRGSLRFEGERDYIGVLSNRLSGNVKRTYKQVCKRRTPLARASRAPIREELVALAAIAQIRGETRFFQAFKVTVRGKGGTEFGVSIEFGAQSEKVGRVLASKVALTGLEDESSASYLLSRRGADPVTAEITPPSPFSGTGLYRAEGDMPATWTGALGVRLPGLGLVPLTGPEFEPTFCRAANQRESTRCFDQLEAALEPFYGSGSHSQPLALARLSSLR